MPITIKNKGIWDKAVEEVYLSNPGETLETLSPIIRKVYEKMGGLYFTSQEIAALWTKELAERFGITASADKPIIVVDFDDTISDYSEGYQGATKFGDPIPGAVEAIKALRKMGFVVLLYTCRKENEALKEYLEKHGFEFDGINTTKFNKPTQSDKPQAEYYIDDHALRFDKNNGGWEAILKQIQKLQQEKAEGCYIVSVTVYKAPVSEDLELWNKITEEVEKEKVYEKDSKEFVTEVLKRFQDAGGLEMSVHINRTPESLCCHPCSIKSRV